MQSAINNAILPVLTMLKEYNFIITWRAKAQLATYTLQFASLNTQLNGTMTIAAKDITDAITAQYILSVFNAFNDMNQNSNFIDFIPRETLQSYNVDTATVIQHLKNLEMQFAMTLIQSPYATETLESLTLSNQQSFADEKKRFNALCSPQFIQFIETLPASQRMIGNVANALTIRDQIQCLENRLGQSNNLSTTSARPVTTQPVSQPAVVQPAANNPASHAENHDTATTASGSTWDFFANIITTLASPATFVTNGLYNLVSNFYTTVTTLATGSNTSETVKLLNQLTTQSDAIIDEVTHSIQAMEKQFKVQLETSDLQDTRNFKFMQIYLNLFTAQNAEIEKLLSQITNDNREMPSDQYSSITDQLTKVKQSLANAEKRANNLQRQALMFPAQQANALLGDLKKWSEQMDQFISPARKRDLCKLFVENATGLNGRTNTTHVLATEIKHALNNFSTNPQQLINILTDHSKTRMTENQVRPELIALINEIRQQLLFYGHKIPEPAPLSIALTN